MKAEKSALKLCKQASHKNNLITKGPYISMASWKSSTVVAIIWCHENRSKLLNCFFLYDCTVPYCGSMFCVLVNPG